MVYFKDQRDILILLSRQTLEKEKTYFMVIYKSGALYWLNEITPSNYDVIRTGKGY